MKAFVGRAAEAGDELGSRMVAARVVRDLIRLCFLLERAYAPYSKWLGTAFARLDAAATVGPFLAAAVAADTYQRREDALVLAYGEVARRHNAAQISYPQEPTARLFHDRPFRVIDAGRFAQACVDAIADAALRALPLVGAVDQWWTRRMCSATPVGCDGSSSDTALSPEPLLDNSPMSGPSTLPPMPFSRRYVTPASDPIMADRHPPRGVIELIVRALLTPR